MTSPSAAAAPRLSKFLYAYFNNACVQTLEVAPGLWRLSVDRRGALALHAEAPAGAFVLARLELLKDGDATIRAATTAIKLSVNNRACRESPLSLGDELLVEGHLMIWGQRRDLKEYVLASESDTPALVVEDGPGQPVIVEAALPQSDWGTPGGDGIQLPAGDAPIGGGDSRKGHRQMSSLLLLSQQINSLLDLEAVLEKCLESIFRILLVDRAAILLRDEATGRLEIRRAAYRRGKLPESIRVPESITRQAAERKVALLARNLPEDPRYQDRPSVVESGLQAAMAIPLALGERQIGMLYADTSNPAVQFSIDDLRFLSILANLTTVAFANSQRVLTLERKTEALEASLPAAEFVAAPNSKAQDAVRLVERVANSWVTVLLTGESGCGKEVLARCLHQKGSRAERPFVAVNCAAIPETLIESELFGVEVGAFTGAGASRPGKFELAEGGTLMLDEIGEIPLGFQAKLLRAIEGNGFERVGGTRTLKPRVRIVAATNRNLRAAVSAGSFREDLFYRLTVFPIHIPPLRERRDDILPLAEHFVAKFAGEMKRGPMLIAPEARDLLVRYDWPGNARELRNMMERVVILAEGNAIEAEPLADALRLDLPGGASDDDAEDDGDDSLFAGEEGVEKGSLWDREIAAIRDALVRSGGNRSKAARLLGISRHHLIYRIKKYGIPVK
jgi:Nif-specific regulatory protein